MTLFRELSFSGLTRPEMFATYRHLLRTHGPNKPQALGWNAPESQVDRYRVLLQGVAPHSSLIDFGCGLGDLYAFAQRAGLPVRYKGVDIMPETVRAARQKHPHAQFTVSGSLKRFPNRSYDHVVSSGVFNLRLVDHLTLLVKTLADFKRVAKKGFALDLLSLEHSPHVDQEQFFAIDRETLQQLLKGLNYKIQTSAQLRSHFVLVRLDQEKE